MSETSKTLERSSQVNYERDRIPARPGDVIREADLDKISGGGGAAGGVIARQHV
jgi:hypothetical protein